MKNYKKLFIPVFTFGLLSFSSVFAGGIDHFEVLLSPEETNVGEAIDLTINAVDKNNVVVEDYNGTIVIFSESDPEAVLPSKLEDNTYSFSASDQGSIKFENAVIFKNSGRQDLYVYDLDDDTVLGVGEVLINKVEKVEEIEISILSPENGLIIGENSINISGVSQKNHNINIIVNDSDTLKTTTNEQGTFEYEIKDLESGENTFKAQILNAAGDIIGESDIVKIEVNSNQPKLKNIKVTPESVEIESSYLVELITNNLVINASVIIDENIIELDKDTTKEGVFTKSIYAPSQDGNYSIGVILKDELGHEITELGVGNIIVTKPELNVSGTGEIEDNNIELNVPNEIKKDLTIKGLKVIELKSKSILTWDKIEGVEGYNVYKKIDENNLELVQKVTEPKFEIEFDSDEVKYDYFAIKAIAKTSSGELYEGSLSDATKVKTGPEVIILLFLSLIIGGLFFFTKNKKA